MDIVNKMPKLLFEANSRHVVPCLGGIQETEEVSDEFAITTISLLQFGDVVTCAPPFESLTGFGVMIIFPPFFLLVLLGLLQAYGKVTGCYRSATRAGRH